MSISVLYMGENLSAIEAHRKALHVGYPRRVHLFSADTLYDIGCLMADEGPFDLFIGASKDTETGIAFYEQARANSPDAPFYFASDTASDVIQDAMERSGLIAVTKDQIISNPHSLVGIVQTAAAKFNLLPPEDAEIRAPHFRLP